MINFLQTQPDSHGFGSLKNVIVMSTMGSEQKNMTKEYMLVGFSNSIKYEYVMVFNRENMIEVPPNKYFKSIEEVIEYLNMNENLDGFVEMIQNTLNNGYDLKRMTKMGRSEVYNHINSERQYQDSRWRNGKSDFEKDTSEWVTYIEHHLNKAKNKIYELDNDKALAEIRKVAALAVRCLEIHGCPKRINKD